MFWGSVANGLGVGACKRFRVEAPELNQGTLDMVTSYNEDAYLFWGLPGFF